MNPDLHFHQLRLFLGHPGAVIALLAAAFASSPSQAREARGLALAAAGRCEEAIELLAPAYSGAVFDAKSAIADARCRIRLKRYAEAVALLRQLRDRAPGLPEVDLYLAIAAYHVGEIDESGAALERALEQLPGSAEAHLYRGILALERSDPSTAVGSFERARELDAQRVEPMASYYAGVARMRLGLREQAREDLLRAAASDPEGPWAVRAQRLLDQIAARSARRWSLRGTLGVEYDDNVILRGDDVTLPEDISDEADTRIVWMLKGSSELLKGDLGALGILADYAGTAHLELSEFDVHYPRAALWWQRAVGERNSARFEYRFGYAWVDGDPYVVTHLFGPAWIHAWPTAGRTTARASGFAYRYHDEPDDISDGVGVPGDPCPVGPSVCGTPGVDESDRRARTGIGYEIAVDHRVRLHGIEPEVAVTPGLRFQQYFARGAESEYLAVEPRVDVRLELPFQVFANTGVSYSYRPFRSGSSLPDSDTLVSGRQFAPTGRKRRDHTVRTSVGLERTFADRFVAEVRYTFTNNDSNEPASDYDRNVVGGYITYKLGGPSAIGTASRRVID